MWPKADSPSAVSTPSIPTNLKVPESKPEFFAWARPTKNPDPVDSTRGWVMAITGLSNRKVRCELTILVQGFVSQRQLAMEVTGNWNTKSVDLIPEANHAIERHTGEKAPGRHGKSSSWAQANAQLLSRRKSQHSARSWRMYASK